MRRGNRVDRNEKVGAGMKRILLLDGDAPGGARRGEQLKQAGIDVVRADDEIAALAAVRADGIDLVLLHLSVADSAAMDFPNVLRRVSAAPYLPVVILADTPTGDHSCALLDSGADDVIGPATSPSETLSRIRAMLRVKSLQDQLGASRSALAAALRRERKLLAKLRRDNTLLHTLATTDPLTQVQNVRSFQGILEHEFRIARRYNQPLSLLMLDVDHFKVVNDTFGHVLGDYVLRELAVILKLSTRESDVVARTGGEEFSAILPHTTRAQAARFAERIRREVQRRDFVVSDRAIRITVSLGCATYPADAEITSADMHVYYADQALLQAKDLGRNRVVAVSELSPAERRRVRRQYLAVQSAMEDPCQDLPPTPENNQIATACATSLLRARMTGP